MKEYSVPQDIGTTTENEQPLPFLFVLVVLYFVHSYSLGIDAYLS